MIFWRLAEKFETRRLPQFGARGLGVSLEIFLIFHDFVDMSRNPRMANLAKIAQGSVPEGLPRHFLQFS